MFVAREEKKPIMSGSNTNKRIGSSKFPSSSPFTSHLNQRQATSAKLNAGATKKDEFLNKEEEYKRLNAELEKKTANLVYEAEQVLKANEKLLSDTDYLNKVADIDLNTIGFKPTAPKNVSAPIKISTVNHQSNKFKPNNNILDFDEISKFRANINRETGNDGDEDDDFNQRDHMTEYHDANYDQINAYLNEGADEERNQMIPRAVNEMSNEAQIRFLKAKLKVMQEELDRNGVELNKKDEENIMLAQRCKDLDEDRAKQLRISNSHQTQLDKFKKLNEDLQAKLTQSDSQSQLMKKENDQLKRDLKKAQQDQQQLEIKQNRSAEEVDKLKLELSKQLTHKKDGNEQEKLKLDSLSSENKRLQKQKVELIQAFKKQLKLIDILKKQKMHLEAAKILQFSEQEFINALEWNSNQSAGANAGKTSARPPSSSGSNRNLTKPENKKNAAAVAAAGGNMTRKPPKNRSKSDDMSSNSVENFSNNNNKMENLALEENLDNYDDDENYEVFNQDYNNIKYNVNDDDEDLDIQDYQNYDSDIENRVK